MPESQEDREKRLLRELEAKNIAHYSVLLEAWIQTRMARDKSLVTLSAGGVGVLVTLLTTVGVSRPWQIWLYIGSFLGFLATIALALMIYQKNSEQIENDLRGRSSEHLKLKAFDRASIATFGVGAFFAVAIAVSSGLTHTPTEREDAMSNYEAAKGQMMKKSLEGLSNLRPQLPEHSAAQTQPPAGQQQQGEAQGAAPQAKDGQ